MATPGSPSVMLRKLRDRTSAGVISLRMAGVPAASETLELAAGVERSYRGVLVEVSPQRRQRSSALVAYQDAYQVAMLLTVCVGGRCRVVGGVSAWRF
jgi:hypothetical protein